MLMHYINPTLWSKVLNHFSFESKFKVATTPLKSLKAKEITPSSSGNTNASKPLNAVEPLIRLWILRLLIPLDCHRQFIRGYRFSHTEIAKLFNFVMQDDIVDDVLEDLGIWDFDADQSVFEGMCNEENQSKTSQFDAQGYRNRLQRYYLAAEKSAKQISLPQPLANNIQQLAEQVGLSEVEKAILVFVVMMNTERLLDQAIQWLGSELNSLKVYHILSVLLGFPESEIRTALSSRSVLSQTALVVMDRRSKHSLDDNLDVLSRVFADRLMSETGSPVDWLRDMIIPSQLPQLTLEDYTHIRESLDYLAPYLEQAIQHKRKGVNVFLYGAPGTGKTQLTRLLAQIMHCPLYEIASEDNDGDPISGQNRLRAFRAAQAFFQNSPAALLFDEVEDVFNDGNGLMGQKSTAQIRKAWMNRLLEENPVPTFWLGNTIHSIDPAFIRRFDWVIQIPVPPKRQREQIIRKSCSNVLTDQTIKRLAACEELAPAVVTRAAKVIDTLNGQFPVEKLSTVLQQMMDKTLQAQGHAGLEREGSVHLPDFYSPEFINCEVDVKQLVTGIANHSSARLCLYGPPGTGKTAYSRWLAEQLDKPLHVKRGADLLSMWVGGTEKNIARVFKEAEQDHAILLIDEVDSFLQDRNSRDHSWEITAVNEMLTRMETFNGIFIASTNRLEGLDTASLRRFDLKLKFGALKPEQAWKLLLNFCASLGIPTPSTQFKSAIANLEGLTPGDFSVLARQHHFRPLDDAHALLAALQEECALKTPYQRQPIGFI